MVDGITQMLPVRSEPDDQDRGVIDHIPRYQIDARFVASLISHHYNFELMRKNQRVEPGRGSNAYGKASGRKKPAEPHAMNVTA